MGRTLSLPVEDLRQVGSLGLLRAIEAFEPSRGRTLSSFAVPYIRGAIQHELRDRASLMRIPRPLWELRRRATVLQDRRRRLGQAQLAPAQLAQALDCTACQVVEALQLAGVVEMRSLDAPSSADGGEEAKGRTLLEALADPSSLAEAHPMAAADLADDPLAALISGEAPPLESAQAEPPGAPLSDGNKGFVPSHAEAMHSTAAASRRERVSQAMGPTGWPHTPERSWLQHRLSGLNPQERQLLVGHVCLGRSWAELGRDLDLAPRQAQRRTVSLLRRLEAEARRWSDGDAAGGMPS